MNTPAGKYGFRFVGRMKSSEYSLPTMSREIQLNSTPAQQVFQVCFERCDAVLRSISVVLPVVAQNEADRKTVTDSVDRIFSDILAGLHLEQERLIKVAHDSGVDNMRVVYTKSAKFTANLTCNKSGTFLQLILEFDKLVELVNAAWLNGLVTDDANRQLERQWRNKLVGAISNVEDLKQRAFDAAANLRGSSDSVNQEEAIAVQKPPQVFQAA